MGTGSTLQIPQVSQIVGNDNGGQDGRRSLSSSRTEERVVGFKLTASGGRGLGGIGGRATNERQ